MITTIFKQLREYIRFSWHWAYSVCGLLCCNTVLTCRYILIYQRSMMSYSQFNIRMGSFIQAYCMAGGHTYTSRRGYQSGQGQHEWQTVRHLHFSLEHWLSMCLRAHNLKTTQETLIRPGHWKQLHENLISHFSHNNYMKSFCELLNVCIPALVHMFTLLWWIYAQFLLCWTAAPFLTEVKHKVGYL